MRLLSKEANQRGDLFARLVGDVFLAQGYEDPRLNIHKTGREIDLKARHRLEDKVAVGECKATAQPIGGDDLNKFAGVLQLEAEASSGSVQGYFISLGGFRESAREQEEEAGGRRFVMLDGQDVADQLVAGGLVVPPEKACEAAGRLAAEYRDLTLLGSPELLAHPIGWLWLCRYERNHTPSHYVLVHADGRPLGEELARVVAAGDQEVGGDLATLTCIGPPAGEDEASVARADEKYRAYLLAELGQITLEGLPADEEVGAKRIALEDLYIPLELERSVEGAVEDGSPDGQGKDDADDHSLAGLEEAEEAEEAGREPVGQVLERSSRIAILAAPGAGKSTLIKRLAVAYARPDFDSDLGDDLPASDWLPIFIRCRTLGDLARVPIRRIIAEIPSRGEFPECRSGFGELVSAALREGKVLLLVDGLDEISAESDRLAFVRQLRTFVGTYPNVALVLTSRETGFRVVAGAMSSMCEWYSLAEFDDEDIVQLTRSWHATVVGRSKKVDEDASALAQTIVSTDRVRRLARNPLLLTTLLLVKRWVGDLPRKRTVLYEKAIDVLLMTWNVEAHEPIDREEAIPQLAYVAHALTDEGEQSLSSRKLTRLLEQAREQMPEILGFARTSVSKFVERIESRSSLLTMTGHVEEDGVVVPSYEFRHLTFQEYLTAVALVEGYYRGHAPADQLADKLEPHFDDSRWLEVMALANVRAGRTASDVVTRLITRLSSEDPSERPDALRNEATLLARALADEVQLPPQLVREATLVLGRSRRITAQWESLSHEISEGRYGELYRQVISEAFLDDSKPDFADFGNAYATLFIQSEGEVSIDDVEAMKGLVESLESDDDLEVLKAAFVVMYVAFRARFPRKENFAKHPSWPILLRLSTLLVERAQSSRPYIGYACAWALAWLGDLGAIVPEDRVRGLRAMLGLWKESDAPWLRKQAAWAFAAMPLVDRAEFPFAEPDAEMLAFIEAESAAVDNEWRDDRRPAAVMLAYYLGRPWPDEEIGRRARALVNEDRLSFPGIRHLTALAPEEDADPS